MHRLVLESNFRYWWGKGKSSNQKLLTFNSEKKGLVELFENIYSLHHEHL